jgi:hypothetical protein
MMPLSDNWKLFFLAYGTFAFGLVGIPFLWMLAAWIWPWK